MDVDDVVRLLACCLPTAINGARGSLSILMSSSLAGRSPLTIKAESDSRTPLGLQLIPLTRDGGIPRSDCDKVILIAN